MDWEYRTLRLDDNGFSGGLGNEASGSLQRESGERWEFFGAYPLSIHTGHGTVTRLGVVYRRRPSA